MTTIMRASKLGGLLNMKSIGFNPSFVIDIGADVGTSDLYEAFPESEHIMVEPIAERESALRDLCSTLPNATYIIAGASSKSGSSSIWAKPDDGRSELIAEDGHVPDGAQKRIVNTITVDELIQVRGLKGRGLLKVDVDGREIDVLEGSEIALQENIDCLIIEATLFVLVHDIINFMTTRDWVIYDIVDPLYRELDNALWQVDLIFVKKNSVFRQRGGFR